MLWMKKVIAAMAVAILALGYFTLHMAFARGTDGKSSEAMEQAILALLTDETFEAVQDYYGEPKQYMDPTLLSLKKISEYPDCFEAVIQVESFYGPHNPPYGIETITFHIQYDKVTLVNFQHQDDS